MPIPCPPLLSTSLVAELEHEVHLEGSLETVHCPGPPQLESHFLKHVPGPPAGESSKLVVSAQAEHLEASLATVHWPVAQELSHFSWQVPVAEMKRWVAVLVQPVQPDPSHPEHSVGQLLHLWLGVSWNWLLPHLQVLPVLVRVAPLADQLAHVSHWSELGPEQVAHVP